MDGKGYIFLENQAFSTVTSHTVQSLRLRAISHHY